HPGQIFLAYSRFSHLLKRNKTWDTSVPGGVGDASVEVKFARMNVVDVWDVVLSHGVILYVVCGQE
ncbi:hypothetical protein L3H49_10540, partial [Corynebacterium sp. MC-01]|uniref:hypothetical protein n=1 Tax=Corynebacterium parakroppenstedtii TaxID=2828363 RepID=UPI001F1A339C